MRRAGRHPSEPVAGWGRTEPPRTTTSPAHSFPLSLGNEGLARWLPMNTCCTREAVGGCPGRLVCRCLRVTESVVVRALTTGGARSLKELRQETGAGDGCTACHRLLRSYLERHFPESQPA